MRIWSKALLAACSFSVSIFALSATAAVPRPAPAAQAGNDSQLRALGRPAATPTVALSAAKLDGSLTRMQSAYAAALAAGTQASLDLHRSNPLARLRYSTPLAAPSVLVDAIVKGDPQVVKQQLEQLGFKSSAVFRNDIGGWLPLDQIAKAQALTGLRFFKTAMMRTKTTPPGPQATQGDFVQRSLALKQSTLYPGLTGAGITVGLISDSFDCASVANGESGATTHLDDYADDVALGALPAGVNVIEEDPGCPDGTDEGRALAQIVYAVAPGAQLAFYTADGSEADFAQGILTLALPTNQTDPNGRSGGGAQIIDDDVGYEDEPVFQEGEVGLAIDQVAAQGVLYFSSAGNEGRDSYENATPSFTGNAGAKAPNAGEKLLNMDISGATKTYYLPITIPRLAAGDGFDIALFWDQPYQSGYANDPGDVIGDAGVANGPGATSVVDICIGSPTGAIPSNGLIVGSDKLDSVFNGPLGTPTNCAGPSNVAPVPSSGYTTTQPGESDPYNFIQIFNTGTETSEAVQASLVVGLISGPPPGRIKILIQDDGRGTQITKFVTASSTIQGHPLSPNAMAVGASFFYDTPACTSSLSAPVLEAFSSAGGSPFLFDVNGNALNPPVMPQKPDIVAPDGISTTFFGFPGQDEVEGSFSTPVPQCQLNPAFPFNFFGTSAAAPHAAGAAALMLQAAANAGVTVSNAQVYAALRQTAADMSSPGFDFDTGFGFVQADAAVAALLPAQLSLSAPSFSFTAAGTQTETLTNTGTGPLTVGNVQATPAGITATSNCPATVAAGASCSITLTAASSVAANQGALSFSTNAQGMGGSASIPLSAPAQISVSPQSVSLVAQQSGVASQAVTVSNSGLGPLSVSGVQVSPASVSQANTCSAPLASGGTCTVTLTLVTTTTGSGLGSLVVGSNAGNVPGGTASVPVSATVNAPGSGGAFTPWLLLPGLALSGLRRLRRRRGKA
jgi:hypothetical protein